MPESLTGQLVFCGRGSDECDGIAEPELDGEAAYYKCTKPECGFEFGYQVVSQSFDTCQIGVPEDVRLKYSTEPPQHGGVFLGSTIKRRAE